MFLMVFWTKSSHDEHVRESFINEFEDIDKIVMAFELSIVNRLPTDPHPPSFVFPRNFQKKKKVR